MTAGNGAYTESDKTVRLDNTDPAALHDGTIVTMS
jgi:hypothetical protein